MYEINKIYQDHVQHELKQINKQDYPLLNKERVHQKILAFLTELGKVGEESCCFSFWDTSKQDVEKVLEYYIDGLQLLLSIGFELQVTTLKNYTEINDPTSLIEQFLKVYEGALKIKNTYSFEEYQNSIDDYFTLGFKLDFDFHQILDAYKKQI